MAENKTKPTRQSVSSFINSIDDKQKRGDSKAVMKMMEQVTTEKPKMWGSSIVGFGTYHYKYDSGREGDFMLTGFSPRKQALTLYIMPGFARYAALMKKLGKHKTGKSCLYIKSLEDIDQSVLRELVKQSVAHTKKTPHK
jgi:hypothetical protein